MRDIGSTAVMAAILSFSIPNDRQLLFAGPLDDYRLEVMRRTDNMNKKLITATSAVNLARSLSDIYRIEECGPDFAGQDSLSELKQPELHNRRHDILERAVKCRNTIQSFRDAIKAQVETLDSLQDYLHLFSEKERLVLLSLKNSASLAENSLVKAQEYPEGIIHNHITYYTSSCTFPEAYLEGIEDAEAEANNSLNNYDIYEARLGLSEWVSKFASLSAAADACGSSQLKQQAQEIKTKVDIIQKNLEAIDKIAITNGACGKLENSPFWASLCLNDSMGINFEYSVHVALRGLDASEED